MTKSKSFNVHDMMSVLRNEDAGICMSYKGSFVSTGSQVLIINKCVLQGEFNFAKIFGKPNDCAEERKKRGHEMLFNLSEGNTFSIEDMLCILRDKHSNICRGRNHSHPTASSQVTSSLL